MMKNFLLFFAFLSTTISIGQVDVSLINQTALTESITTVNCMLENGTSTQCYQLKFYVNIVDDSGPFCPTTINDIGGMGIYNPGTLGTDLGLSAMDSNLFNVIEADGYDIVQTNGDINVYNASLPMMPPAGTSYCLQAEKDDDLEITYLIPITPEDLSVPNTIETVEQLGFSMDGIPFKGDPPAAIGSAQGGGTASSDVQMPALDPCGGHHDPAGYYHWHMVANSTNDVLSDLSINQISCSTFPQDNTSIMGYAMDGYPIYGQFEDANQLPTNLDACNGHIGITDEYPSGTYHYHAVQGVAPNTPPCLTGASAQNSFSVEFYDNTSSIEENEIFKDINVFPNPSQGDIVDIYTTATELSLIDQLGRQISDETIIEKTTNGFTINTSYLTAGVYNIVLYSNGESVSKKLVIQNH